MENITDSAIKLSETLYVAMNQNGFNQCLYHHFKCDDKEHSYSKKDVRKMVQNWPTYNDDWYYGGLSIYPCAFVIIDQTFECSRIYIDIIPPFTFDDVSHIVSTNL